MGKLAFLCLCLNFGTTPKSVEYTTSSEAEFDLGKNLLVDTPWYATNLQLLHRHLLTREDYLPDSEPLVKADQLAVDIEAREVSTDGFIDDIITIIIDDP